jgi:hypothetical protein
MNSISDLRKKRNRIKKQLQKIALIEGHDWRNLVREERPLRKKFIQQWGKHHRGMTNSFVVVANQYAALVSKEKKARDILDTKFRPYLEQIVDLDCKIQKAKNMTKSHLTPR